jgi:hypothetical protein
MALEPTTVNDAATANAGTRRRRGVLAGFSLVIACLTIVLATVGIWVHQVALNTDRFTALVTQVVADPAVVEPIAGRVSQQVVTALDIETRIGEILPGPAAVLAGPMTNAVQDAIDQRLQKALANPDVQDGLIKTLRFSHERVVAFLRGETEAISIVDGYVQLSLYPIVGAALEQLQQIGLIPADVVLPDLTSSDTTAALSDRLEAAVGVTLPADFGTVQLMQADRLAAAQTFVKIFDVVVVALIILAVALVVFTIWLARDRRRMVLYVAIGTAISMVLARFLLDKASTALLGGVADQGVLAAMTEVVDTTVADLVRVMTVVLIATIALAIVAYVAGRPAWLVSLATKSTGAAASAAQGASGAGRSTVVRENRTTIERFGLASIVFALAWIAISFEVALLGAALVVAWLLIVKIVVGDPTDQATTAGGPEPDQTPAGEPESGGA